jgi:hypothetical protein
MSYSSTFSVYIPRVSAYITVQMIQEEFIYAGIGVVKRVDFTPTNKKAGFCEDMEDLNCKSAFVHYDVYNMNMNMNMMSPEGLNFQNVLLTGKTHKFWPKCVREYWIILPNRKPIQDTLMNNAQIVENCRLLEKKVEEQTTQIETLERRIERLEAITTAMLHFDRNEELFEPQDEEDAEEDDSGTHSSMPDLMEASVSTFSSMPDLLNDSSDDEEDSIPDLVSTSTTSSEQRWRNTYELCGNE